MIEEIIVKFLNQNLEVPVTTEHPDDKLEQYVIVEKTSGSQENYLKSATIAAQSYAPSMYEAAALNEKVKTAFEKMITLDVIRGVHLNSDYNYTDTETKNYRYQAVFDINHY